MQLHELIQKTRLETGTTIKDMAKILECSYYQYKQAESGDFCPKHSSLYRFAKHFDIKEDMHSLYLDTKENLSKRRKPIYHINYPHVSAIQKAVQSAFLIGVSPITVHAHMIPLYWNYYKEMNNETFQTLALEHIVACIKSNYDYTEMIPLFTEIAASVGYGSFELFLSNIRPLPKKTVKLTYSRLLTIFGKGSACDEEGSLSKNECVKDAWQKIEQNQEGCYCFSIKERGFIKNIYLIIDKFGVYMQDNDGIEYIFDSE